jgi:lipopolysaccharide transport system ATP-binding protein
MPEAMITVNNVSKKFCRDLKRSLWYGVQDISTELIGSQNNRRDLRKDEFWAVKDVSFEVARGEAVGLIGHNGAGKTTLLRMFNGLIKPDFGLIKVKGRMQALIALGAGFNPILTGRENVYVNASILGISKAETDRRFNEIVDFSGIEEFIDMPVQSYSSGMTVRLGFAIAAHLEPDILLVDEVLAVGDLAFKTKCQLRIQELKQNGVAIIFVSHNLHAISHVCSRGITMERGQMIFDGPTEEAIDVYRTSLIKSNKAIEDLLRAGTGEIRVSSLEILNEKYSAQQEYETGEYVNLRIHYKANTPVNNPVFNITLNVLNDQQVTGIRTDLDGFQSGILEGEGYIDVNIPRLYLLPNVYTIDAIIFHQDGFTFYDRVNNIGQLRIKGGLQVNGTTFLPHSWKLNSQNKIVALNSERFS